MSPKIFGREPAVIVGLIQAFLALLVSFGALSFADITGQAELALVTAVIIAAGDLYVAYATQQTLLGVAVGFVKAFLAFIAIYGLTLSTEQTGALIALLTVAVGFFQRTQVNPVAVGNFNLKV